MNAKGFFLAAMALSCLFKAPPVLADAIANIKSDGAQFTSASHAAQAVLTSNGTAYEVSVHDKPTYTTTPAIPRLNLGSAFISDDGETIAWMLAEHFLGRIDDQSLKSPALIFFRKGVAVKTYSLSDLLVRPKLVSLSVSHTEWIPEKRDANWKFSPCENFAADGSRLEFETTSLRHYIFNPKTATMISGEDSDIWKKADAIVYSETKANGGKLQLKAPKFIKGAIDHAEACLINDPTGSYDSGWHSIALRKENDGWTTFVPDYQLPTLYNILP